MSPKKKVEKKKKKKTAMVICGDRKEFWTTQLNSGSGSEKVWLPRPVICP